MARVDLDTVIARRASLARELASLEKLRAEIGSEDEELAVAERVLKRLSDAGPRTRSASEPMAGPQVVEAALPMHES